MQPRAEKSDFVFAFWNFSSFWSFVYFLLLTIWLRCLALSSIFDHPALKICHFEFWLPQLKTKFVPILPNITSPGEWRLCFSSLNIFSLICLYFETLVRSWQLCVRLHSPTYVKKAKICVKINILYLQGFFPLNNYRFILST